jgi:hypothetical protein
VAEVAYPFPQTPATVNRWARMARLFGLSSILGTPAQNMYAATVAGMTLTIGRGTTGVAEAFVRGFMHTLDAADWADTIAANTATQARMDRVVLRMDLTTATLRIVRLPGTPAATPTAPALTQTDTVWDLPLWRVTVPANSGAPLTGLIDDRYWTDVDTGWSGYAGATATQVFTASGTWTKPTGAKIVEVTCIGAGGGGGASFPGAGGGRVTARIPADQLPATVAVSVGTGGAGGNTARGGSGGGATFGAYVGTLGGGGYLVDSGNVPGGGTPFGLLQPTTSTVVYPEMGAHGTAGSQGANSAFGGGAGGSGGSSSGSYGGSSGLLGGSPAGTNAAGTAGQSRSGSGLAGSGGGGAGGVGFNGGAGGIPGGGGGGMYSGGFGGNGGRGEVLVTSYF